MLALISDIHANLEALCAVFNDIDKAGVDRVDCLGDIVGYGPDPEACTDIIIERVEVALMGNHDFALKHGPIGFNPMAADIIRRTRARMNPSENHTNSHATDGLYPCDCPDRERRCLIRRHGSPERWAFVTGLPQTYTEDDRLYVHGSPLDPVFEYVFPDRFAQLWSPGHLQAMFAEIESVAFCGHTHHPCVITSDIECLYPPDLDYRFELRPDKKYIINVGSVGQPRDGDPRACYLLYDESRRAVEWRRIPYDIETTVGKSVTMCGEDNWCGKRLRMGK